MDIGQLKAPYCTACASNLRRNSMQKIKISKEKEYGKF